MSLFVGCPVPTNPLISKSFFKPYKIIIACIFPKNVYNSVMPNYHRFKIEGAYYFFTVVTYKRRSLFTDDNTITVLKNAFQQVKSDRPFEMSAVCLLPDHLHCIWKMSHMDSDYSTRWSIIKRIFSKTYVKTSCVKLNQTRSRQKKRELPIFQRRFWEHYIRNEYDYWKHVHYIHYNPYRHGLVKHIADWPYSTYHRFCREGYYKNFDWSKLQKDITKNQFHFYE